MVSTRRSLGRGMLAGLATIGLQAVFASSATVAQERPITAGTRKAVSKCQQVSVVSSQ